MKYSIGDVARTLGLTPGALHYLEREGIIFPKKLPNGRRLYSEQDVFRLMSYKKYRSMGIPVKEIARQFAVRGDSLSAISHRLALRREAAAERERYYRDMQPEIAWFEEAIARIPSHLGRHDVCSSPELYIFRGKRAGIVPESRAAQQQVQAWLSRMPQTRLSIILEMDGWASFCPAGRDKPAVMDAKDARVERLPSMMSLHTIARLPPDFFNTPAIAFSGTLSFLSAHGFSRNGPAIGHAIVTDCSGDAEASYVELWVPFTAAF